MTFLGISLSLLVCSSSAPPAQPSEQLSDVVGVASQNLPHVPSEDTPAAAVVPPQSETVANFDHVLARSHAGDLNNLYQVCLFLLPNLVTADVWDNVFGIDEPDKFLTEPLAKHHQTSEKVKQLKIDEIDAHGKRLFLLPREFEKTEGRVEKLFRCIQEAAKNGILEASSFLQGLAKSPHYLERQVFFEHLSSLLANQLSDQGCKYNFVEILEQINKSKLTTEKVKELLSIYLRSLGLESAQQRLVEVVQKDLMNKTFSFPAFCLSYCFVIFVPVLSIIWAYWLYFIDCEQNSASSYNDQLTHTNISQTSSHPYEEIVTTPPTTFPCKDRIDRDFRFLTIAAGCAASLPVLYNAYRAYKQVSADEYAARREAELLSTALVVLDEKYNSGIWDWQRKLQSPYYFLTCLENMKRKYLIK